MICNLQPTKQDRKADLNIHTYVDDVMRMVSSVSKYFSHLPNIFLIYQIFLHQVMENLGLDIPQYDRSLDPVRR